MNANFGGHSHFEKNPKNYRKWARFFSVILGVFWVFSLICFIIFSFTLPHFILYYLLGFFFILFVLSHLYCYYGHRVGSLYLFFECFSLLGMLLCFFSIFFPWVAHVKILPPLLGLMFGVSFLWASLFSPTYRLTINQMILAILSFALYVLLLILDWVQWKQEHLLFLIYVLCLSIGFVILLIINFILLQSKRKKTHIKKK